MPSSWESPHAPIGHSIGHSIIVGKPTCTDRSLKALIGHSIDHRYSTHILLPHEIATLFTPPMHSDQYPASPPISTQSQIDNSLNINAAWRISQYVAWRIGIRAVFKSQSTQI